MILNTYERMVARRYLLPGKGEGFIFLVASISLLAVALGVAALIGLVNGILIGGLKLNALIVTLATGQIAVGITSRYVRTFPVQTPVPVALSDWRRADSSASARSSGSGSWSLRRSCSASDTPRSGAASRSSGQTRCRLT